MVVEILGSILRVAAGLGADEHGDRSPAAVKIADGIGGLRRTGKCPDEKDVGIGYHFWLRSSNPV
jgi:hypothetical protein